jgi:LAO/AO transport system kinase
VGALADGVRAGERGALSRAITLVESTAPRDVQAAADLLQTLQPLFGRAVRIGISGAPGVGKSTFLDALGTHLTAAGRRVAVLAVDPSSQVSGGSILGDKTRMPRLSRDPRAFVRPSPGGATLGGVARRTREALLLCEAAGFEVVLVETIGVGQSEVAVAGLVDAFVLLVIGGAGDELQGLKRGVMEHADLVVVNKADGDGKARALQACADYAGALDLLRGPAPAPRVLACSATHGEGIAAVWQAIEAHLERLGRGALDDRRRAQAGRAFDEAVAELLRERLLAQPETRRRLAELRAAVEAGTLAPAAAARRVFADGG